jgi:hypothetical protein
MARPEEIGVNDPIGSSLLIIVVVIVAALCGIAWVLA